MPINVMVLSISYLNTFSTGKSLVHNAEHTVRLNLIFFRGWEQKQSHISLLWCEYG